MIERVRVYDFKTKTINTLPAAELAPGMVQVNLRQDDGSLLAVWVNSEELKLNTYQNPPFPQEIREHFHYLKGVLDDVYPNSIDEWEDLFRRDKNWERELSIWLRIARVYDRRANGRGVDMGRKMDIYKILLTCTMSPRHLVVSVVGLDVLTKQEAAAIVDEFFDTSEQ